MHRWVPALVLVACLPPPDAFRQRVAKGCSSAQECAELEREADNRYRACDLGKVKLQCTEEAEDRNRARDAQRAQRNVVEAERATAAAEAYQNARDARRQFNDFETAFNDGLQKSRCGELKPLEDSIEDTPQAAFDIARQPKERFKEVLRKRLAARAAELTISIDLRMRDKPDLSAFVSPNLALETVESVRKDAAEAKCFGATVDVSEWASTMAKAVAEEEACRASTACMGDRAKKKAALAAIAAPVKARPMPDTPESRFRALVSGALRQYRDMAEGGRGRPHEFNQACMMRFSPTLKDAQAIMARVDSAASADPQFSPMATSVRAYVFTPVVACINCAAGDEARCADATSGIARVAARLQQPASQW